MEVFLAGVGGWLLAYLINYLSDVLPVTRSFSRPECINCEGSFSLRRYLLMQPCTACGQRRSLRAWIVQVGMTLATAWMWLFPPVRLGFWVGTLLLAFFAVIAVIDLEYRLIMHPVSWFGAAAGLAIGIWQKGLLVTALGGIAGYGIMFLLYYLGILFNRWIAKIRHQESEEIALGYGDVNLAGIVGLLLGWPEIVGGLLVAILVGGIISGLIMLGMALLRRYRAMTAIPYAPFLLLGAIIFLYIPKK